MTGPPSESASRGGRGTAPQSPEREAFPKEPAAASNAAAGRILRADALAALVFALLTLALALIPTGFEDRLPRDVLAEKARITAVDNTNVHTYGIVREGEQRVTANILTGPFAGTTVTADNPLLGKMEMDKVFSVGDSALVALTVRAGHIVSAVAQDYYRIDTQLLLLALFAVLLVAYAGWTGAKALLSFLFAALALWKVLVPWFLRGHDPIGVTLGLLAVLMAGVLFLVGGLSRKALAAYLGSLLGVLATCALALAWAGPFSLHGSVKPYAETLLYSGYPHLDLTRIFLATIFLGSCGAVMDLAMDVAASMDEVAAHHPEAGAWTLFRSGLRVGRVVVGTMTTTLLLAYSGGAMGLLMVFMAQGVPLANVFNFPHVAAETFNILVGSFGLVLVGPFTALTGALLLAAR